MTTFHYRDLRRDLVTRALDAISADQTDGGIRGLLEVERLLLECCEWTYADQTYLAVAEDWLWGNPRIRQSIAGDPVLKALGRTPRLTDALESQLSGISRAGPRPSRDYIARVQEIIPDDDTFMEVVHCGHREWLARNSRDYPLDDIGVLLPVRLETLFDPPGSPKNDDQTRWKLSLRITPDEASIRRDNSHVSDEECRALEVFWKIPGNAAPFSAQWLDESLKEPSAWQTLATRVGAARAAWLVSTVEPSIQNGRITVARPDWSPDRPRPNRVGGLPPELRVFVCHSGGRINLGRLPMDTSTRIDGSGLPLPLQGGFTGGQLGEQWWTSWSRAKEVGLAGEWLLPPGVTNTSITAIYVTGIGDESPDSHFRALADAGDLAILPLGAPTNSVHGAPTGGSEGELAEWLTIARKRLNHRLGSQQASEEAIPDFVSAALPAIPGAGFADDISISNTMLTALWPALWGNWLRTVWKMEPAAVDVVGSWAMDNVYPQGPLMPLRIGDQPYGVLPTTLLAGWKGDEVPPPPQVVLECKMAQALVSLRRQWAEIARKSRCVVGKPTSEFMRLLGQEADSSRFIIRAFRDITTEFPGLFDEATNQRVREIISESLYKEAGSVMRRPPPSFITNGVWEGIELPLVSPSQMMYKYQNQGGQTREPLDNFIQRWARENNHSFPLVSPRMDLEAILRWQGWGDDHRRGSVPDSLLVRLLLHSLQLSWAWLKETSSMPNPPPWLNIPQHRQLKGAIDVASWLEQKSWYTEAVDPTTGRTAYGVQIPEARLRSLERALRATLDTAAHRIDPWITGFAWQRLVLHRDSPRASRRLGVYGWVDGPFDGIPGPTRMGRIHAPGYNQAVAALMLRDKFVSSQKLTTPERQPPWKMDITSASVRLAGEIADEVRMGLHIAEVIGRHVEDIVGSAENVAKLRSSPAYAMDPTRRDPNEVCHGIRALIGLLHEGNPDARATIGVSPPPSSPVGPSATEIRLSSDQRARLAGLDRALDTYADLLVADGALHLANRQVARAAETMEAAAGFARPPAFEFPKTPISGYLLETLVVSVVPHVSVATLDSAAGPIRIADPSVAALIDDTLKDSWTWKAFDEADHLVGCVELSEFGFTRADTVAFSDHFLCEWARSKLESRGVVTIERIDPPRQHQVACRLAAALGGLPSTSRGGGAASESDGDPSVGNNVVVDDLSARFERLRIACVDVIDSLLDPAEQPRRAAIPQALRWGALPPWPHANLFKVLESQEASDERAQLTSELAIDLARQLAGRPELQPWALNRTADDLENPPEAESLAKLLRRAAAFGVDEATSQPQPVVADVVNALRSLAGCCTAIPATAADLASAIAALAGPQAKLAVLACRPKTFFDEFGIAASPETLIDEKWLTVIAPTRSSLARLEALQLELEKPLDAWSNSPGDPWRTSLITSIRSRRDSEPLHTIVRDPPRFVVAYGSPNARQADHVAVGVIDAFSEAIPMQQRSTMTAFGFNAPSSRPQQALLLAVPPRQQKRQRLDADVLCDIVAETRELAHARMVRVEDLSELQALTPAMWLTSSGPNRVRLEPWPLFEQED